MFVKARSARDSGGSRSAVGLFIVVVGAILFVHIVQGYMEHMMPIVSSEQSQQFNSERMSSNYYGDPDETLCLSPASPRISSHVRHVIAEQVIAVRSHQFDQAIQLATSDFETSSPTAYAATFEQQYPEIFTTPCTKYLQTQILDGGRMAVQEVVAKTGQSSPSEFTYLLVRERQGWRIANVERGSWTASGMELRCLQLIQYSDCCQQRDNPFSG